MSGVVCALCTGAHMSIDCPRNVDVDRAVLLKPDRRSPLEQPDYRPCGTNAAARRHRRNGEIPEGMTLREFCPPCWEAERAYTLPHARRWRRRNADRERARLRARGKSGAV